MTNEDNGLQDHHQPQYRNEDAGIGVGKSHFGELILCPVIALLLTSQSTSLKWFAILFYSYFLLVVAYLGPF